jgi:CHAT domain-containing protein
VLTIAAKRSHNPALPPLRFVQREVDDITDLTKEMNIVADSLPRLASKDVIISALEAANIVHLACHGIQHSSEPHESHFSLESENLTVTDLMEMNLKHAFVAFLSACETAKGDRTYADEVVHLAATMLFAGFKSVIATMW